MGELPDAVLFDCDGVLVDSDAVCAPVLRQDLQERGLRVSAEEAAEIYSVGTMEQTAAEAARRGADIPDDWVPLFYEKMFDALRMGTEPVAGVSELLDRLIAAGVPRAVASNGPVAKMEITLAGAGLIDRLRPHVYSARDLPRPKPAPDIYLHAARRLGVAPRACVVVEDSASGARAGQAAGMRVIGFAAMGQGGALAPYCDRVVGSMAELANELGL